MQALSKPYHPNSLDAIRLIGSVEEIDALEIRDPDRVAYITQTTLSVDETVDIIAALRERFPARPAGVP